MTHFTAEEWIDFANEAVAQSRRQEMERHLEEGCSRCKKAASLWQKVRQTAKSAADCQPPEDEVRIAKAGFTGNQLYGKRAKVPGLVEVLFDSFLQPLTAGARSSKSGRIWRVPGRDSVKQRLGTEICRRRGKSGDYIAAECARRAAGYGELSIVECCSYN